MSITRNQTMRTMLLFFLSKTFESLLLHSTIKSHKFIATKTLQKFHIYTTLHACTRYSHIQIKLPNILSSKFKLLVQFALAKAQVLQIVLKRNNFLFVNLGRAHIHTTYSSHSLLDSTSCFTHHFGVVSS